MGQSSRTGEVTTLRIEQMLNPEHLLSQFGQGITATTRAGSRRRRNGGQMS